MRVGIIEINERTLYEQNIEQQRKLLASSTAGLSPATAAAMRSHLSHPFETCAYTLEALETLQLLCEGHNETLQNFLKEQVGEPQNVDLLAETWLLLDESARSVLKKLHDRQESRLKQSDVLKQFDTSLTSSNMHAKSVPGWQETSAFIPCSRTCTLAAARLRFLFRSGDASGIGGSLGAPQLRLAAQVPIGHSMDQLFACLRVLIEMVQGNASGGNVYALLETKLLESLYDLLSSPPSAEPDSAEFKELVELRHFISILLLGLQEGEEAGHVAVSRMLNDLRDLTVIASIAAWNHETAGKLESSPSSEDREVSALLRESGFNLYILLRYIFDYELQVLHRGNTSLALLALKEGMSADVREY